MAYDVMEWYSTYESTREWARQKSMKPRTLLSYSLAMRCYCEWRRMDPDGLREEILRLGDREAQNYIRGQLSDFQDYLMESKLPDGTKYAESMITYRVAAMLSFYSVVLGHPIKVNFKVNMNNRKRDQHIPTRLELRKILDCCDLRGKTFILFQATTGFRVGDMLSLCIKDVEPALDDKTDFFTINYVPEKNGKSTKERITVVPPCTVKLLRQYLRIRQDKGEKFVSNTPVFVPNMGGKTPISQNQVNEIIKAAVQKSGIFTDMQKQAGVCLRSHQLRAYFINCLKQDGMANDFVDYMSAHVIKYNGAYWSSPRETLINEYRKHVNAVDPYYDEEKEEAIQRAESLEAQVEDLYKRMERMEDERYSQEISRMFSHFMGGKCEPEIVSDRKTLDKYIAEGCILFPTFEKNRYFVIRPGGEPDG